MAGQRLVKLNPQYAGMYPEIQPGIWLDAWETSQRMAERLWRDQGADALVSSRLLPDEHFNFKGGKRRSSAWYTAVERLSDPRPGELRLQSREALGQRG